MSNSYLVHHGILGQKWGKRNGPPYPLESDQKSYREKKMASSVNPAAGRSHLTDKQKKALIIGASVLGTVATIYAVYKVNDLIAPQISNIKNYDGLVIKGITSDHNLFKDNANSINTNISNSFNGNRTKKVNSINTNISNSFNDNRTKKIEDFTWNAVNRMQNDGSVSTILIPTDKTGYADYFAKEMAKSIGDYDYWYKYIMNRMEYQ